MIFHSSPHDKSPSGGFFIYGGSKRLNDAICFDEAYYCSGVKFGIYAKNTTGAMYGKSSDDDYSRISDSTLS